MDQKLFVEDDGLPGLDRLRGLRRGGGMRPRPREAERGPISAHQLLGMPLRAEIEALKLQNDPK